jgi:hypothetical protein
MAFSDSGAAPNGPPRHAAPLGHPVARRQDSPTNNVGRDSRLGPAEAEARADEAARGVSAVVREIRQRAPKATVTITGIRPRSDNLAVMPIIHRANRQIARLANGNSIRYINISEQLAFPDGHLR